MLESLLKEKRLILVCGSGGVGKTTMAAALALKGAALGLKTIVLTIDPAKRLATSLGLDRLSDEPKRINAKKLADLFGTPDPACFAMMLDTKHTFDQLVAKYAPSKEIEQKILNNKIYRHLSDMIAGSQEYMAMEKLYELATEEKYDLIVIDTPPTTHAIDFLEAPQKMIDAIGHSMIHLLLKPAMLAGKSGLKLFEKGSQMILKIFDRITGFAFLQDISEMLISFQELLGGFQGRAEDVRKILTQDETGFVLVSACEEKSVREAQFFSERLAALGLPLSGVILNRVHPLYRIASDDREENQRELAARVGTKLTAKMADCFDRFEPIARRDDNYRKELKHDLTEKQFLTIIPLFESDIHSLEGLFSLTEYF
ncbi:MAG: ArsA family ATPase [Deltaproteobacteria bacterium]|nr:ArsA family ATPase [Deltaproteobacteria bacterium]